MKIVVDTNVFIRYFLGDVTSEAQKAKDLFSKARSGDIEIIIPQIIIFEIEFVLSKYYGLSKIKIVENLESLLSNPDLEVDERETFLVAIKIWKEKKISLPDSFLLAITKIENLALFTFDKKMKFISSTKLI